MVKHVILWTLKDDLGAEEKVSIKAGIKGYAVNPKHVEVADTKVRPYTSSRVCMDYEV